MELGVLVQVLVEVVLYMDHQHHYQLLLLLQQPQQVLLVHLAILVLLVVHHAQQLLPSGMAHNVCHVTCLSTGIMTITDASTAQQAKIMTSVLRDVGHVTQAQPLIFQCIDVSDSC